MVWSAACGLLIAMGAMGIANTGMQQTLRTDLVQMPPADEHGRVDTLNQMGVADRQSNAYLEKYLEWGRTHAQRRPAGVSPWEQQYMFEVGGAYGFLTKRALEQGIFSLFNDLSADQVDLAIETQFPADLQEGQLETYPGHFPSDFNVGHFQREKRIVGIGSFMVVHFLSGAQIRAFLDACWDILQPGGRVFLTAGTPFNKKFSPFIPTYRARKKAWERPRRGFSGYPGEIEDAWQYLPSDRYPKFFHALDADVLAFIARNNAAKAFTVVEAGYIQRPVPAEQAWPHAYRSGMGELVGIVLEKPVPTLAH